MDLATSLDHILLDPLTENKFQALKLLHAKKIKSLMTSIDNQQKEISKLKVLSKDHHRTQIIQSLKKKLKDQEYINDVLKDEICKKCEINREEINSYIIRKTISGPKRFRPLTREELENNFIELEKKLKIKKSSSEAGGGGGGGGGGSSGGSINGNPNGNGIGLNNGNIDKNLIKKQGNSSSNPLPPPVDDAQYLSKISELQDSLSDTQQLNEQNEIIITQLKDEINRLRSINTNLLIIEEERNIIEKQYNDLTLRYDHLTDELDEAYHQVGVYQEESYQIKLQCELEIENYLQEINILKEQNEKSLKQNTHLLKNMTELENLFHKNQRTGTSTGTSTGSNSGGHTVAESKLDQRPSSSSGVHEKLKFANQRISQLESQLNQTIATSNTTANELLELRSQLREKNNQIRDLKRNMNVVSKAFHATNTTTTPSPSTTSLSPLQSSSNIPTSPSSMEILLSQFTNTLLLYELMSGKASSSTSSSSTSGPLSHEIKNKLFKLLTTLMNSMMDEQQQRHQQQQGSNQSVPGKVKGKNDSRIPGGLQLENLQKFEHYLLSKHPDIGMEDEEEEDLEGVNIRTSGK